MEVDLHLMKHLCMSYNKYIIKRKKLSDAYSKNKTDETLRNNLINFIHLHPDHEYKRQIYARDSSKNILDRQLHNEKIADLLKPSELTYNKRIAYKSIRESETESRTAKHNAKMEEEKLKAIENKNIKLQKARENNANRILKEKTEGETIRLARQNKKNNIQQQ